MIKRGKKFKPDLIISGDWHLRDDQPKCRTDNFWEAQWNKVFQILNLQMDVDVPLFLSGDLLHHWKSSPFLINECMSNFPKDSIFTIIGNHDMPQHNINQMQKSSLTSLFKSGHLGFIRNGGHWGIETTPQVVPEIINKKRIYLLHIMTYKGKSPWPGCTDPECHELFDWFPEADLIITGHNHKTFIAKKGKQLLVNPGSLTRQTTDQIDHKPCVFLYDSNQHKLKKHYLEIKDNVISREHLNVVKAKDKRINAFIEKLKSGWDAGLSFEENIERGIKENKIPKRIQQIIYEWMEI